MDQLAAFLYDLFVSGTSLAEKVLRSIVVYAFLVLILRVGGHRELAQMNAFDLYSRRFEPGVTRPRAS
jgi:hypothetical protein